MSPKVLRISLLFKILLGVVLSLNFNQAWSNLTEKTLENRPKIGLVLAGGGARGLAHIGVIKALEAQKVPIDYISGTSMGALVGGLYAAGLSSAEIEAFANHIDWEQILKDNPPRHYLSFRRKQDQYEYFIPGELGMNHWQLLFPSGLLQGQQQYNLLEGLIVNAGSHTLRESFDQLPIPFRAVATDTENSEAYLLQKGNLATALRASMSVPGVFAPVKIDGRLLVDGGLVNNTPIDVVRNMGAEVVIVSDIHTPKLKQADLSNFVAISDQIISSLTTNNTLTQLATLTPKDLHIKPNLEGFGSGDFNLAHTLIERGQQATLLHQARLNQLAKTTNTPTASTKTPQKLIIHKIQINNLTQLSNKMIQEHIQQPLRKDFNKTLLETNIATLYGTGFFQLLRYEIHPKDNENTLIIFAEAPSWGPNFFKIKFNLASNFYNTHIFNLGLRHTYMPANSMGGEWRNEIQLGDTLHLKSSYYQPLNNLHEYTLKPFIQYQNHVYKIVDRNQRNLFSEFSLEQQTTTFGMSLGYNFSSNLNLDTKIYLENGELAWGPKNTHQIKSTYQDTIFALHLGYDTLNQVAFPDKGTRFTAEVLNNRQTLSPNTLGEEWEIQFSKFHTQGRHTFNAHLEYGEINQADASKVHSFKTLGGFQHLSGFTEDALFGKQIAFGRLKYLYRLSGNSSNSLNFPTYLGATLESGNVYDRNALDKNKSAFKWENTLQAGSLFVGLNSFIGPVYLAYGYQNHENQSLYLYFGKEFY